MLSRSHQDVPKAEMAQPQERGCKDLRITFAIDQSPENRLGLCLEGV
jgi:hypothetical protein